MRLLRALAFTSLALITVSTSGASSVSVPVEARSPAVAHGQLVEDIGIETIGGVFTSLLGRRRTVPCEVTETFSTAVDNQSEIQIRPFHGVAALARETKMLGRFAVSGLPQGPRGTVIVAVTISVSTDGDITLAAREKKGREVQLHQLTNRQEK